MKSNRKLFALVWRPAQQKALGMASFRTYRKRLRIRQGFPLVRLAKEVGEVLICVLCSICAPKLPFRIFVWFLNLDHQIRTLKWTLGIGFRRLIAPKKQKFLQVLINFFLISAPLSTWAPPPLFFSLSFFPPSPPTTSITSTTTTPPPPPFFFFTSFGGHFRFRRLLAQKKKKKESCFRASSATSPAPGHSLSLGQCVHLYVCKWFRSSQVTARVHRVQTHSHTHNTLIEKRPYTSYTPYTHTEHAQTVRTNTWPEKKSTHPAGPTWPVLCVHFTSDCHAVLWYHLELCRHFFIQFPFLYRHQNRFHSKNTHPPTSTLGPEIPEASACAFLAERISTSGLGSEMNSFWI